MHAPSNHAGSDGSLGAANASGVLIALATTGTGGGRLSAIARGVRSTGGPLFTGTCRRKGDEGDDTGGRGGGSSAGLLPRGTETGLLFFLVCLFVCFHVVFKLIRSVDQTVLLRFVKVELPLRGLL